MTGAIGKPIEHVVDGENNAIEFDVAYALKGDIRDAIIELKRLHGEDIRLLPMSATSSGGGVFQNRSLATGTIVGLRFDAPAEPRVRQQSNPPLADIGQDEIVIDTGSQQVCVGCAVTLDQLNRALADEIGHAFKVPGADLTSYQYAATGATFMTGGMGPQRRYFSDSVSAAWIFDGTDFCEVSGPDLQGYAGTYGWSGLVGALRCHYFRFPGNEIAFALPVSSDAANIASLLDHLGQYVYLGFDVGTARTRSGGSDLILGIEHVSIESMQPLLTAAGDQPARARARELQQKCEQAGVDGLVFINGFSERSSDEFLLDLADDPDSEQLCIGGVDIEHAEVFSDPETMRAVREAVPYAARTQAPDGKYLYKNHSDATIRLPADAIAACAERLWQINQRYIERVTGYFEAEAGIDGQILVYGHLNPYGVDPHNRVTMSSNDEAEFEKARAFLVVQRAVYYRQLAELCDSSEAVFVGGEKSADSEIAIYAALGGPEHAPAALNERFRQQCDRIAMASTLFNWRTLEPYCQPRPAAQD